MTTKNLAEQTPAEIDEQLSVLSARKFDIRGYQHADSKPRTAWRAENERERLEREERLAKYAVQLAELEAEMAPFVAEFVRRGGWNRAFYCTAHGGHVHSTMACSTCTWSTEFTWQTWLSGKTQAEIIEEIGMTACTVCYPDAPVAQMATEERKAHSRAEVAARKAEREAVKLAKELAKIPRQHTEAVKVDELVNAFGLHDPSEAYKATWPGERFGKGYSNAYSTYSDMARRRAARRAA